MDLALCHPCVLPARGGCERYVSTLASRLVSAGHKVHLYASRWDSASLNSQIRIIPVPHSRGPRFLRPWHFSAACADLLKGNDHDLTLGFDKILGTDVLYPQGGLHRASVEHNVRKHRHGFARVMARLGRFFDVAHQSYNRLEARQYASGRSPFVLAISEFVRGHLEQYYGLARSQVGVLHCAIDPDRFLAPDRPARRAWQRSAWGVDPGETVALFVAMNYRLKGLEPLLRSLIHMPHGSRFRLVVVGHPKTAGYERLARRLGVRERVIFHGFAADPRDVFFGADVLVHPTFYDPCSLVVLEARACGLPVVTTRYNGASELLDPPHDSRVIADPHDDRALGEAIGTFLDGGHRQQCARHAQANAKRWTWDHHFRELECLLGAALARKQAA